MELAFSISWQHYLNHFAHYACGVCFLLSKLCLLIYLLSLILGWWTAFRGLLLITSLNSLYNVMRKKKKLAYHNIMRCKRLTLPLLITLQAAYMVGGHSFSAACIEYVILKMKLQTYSPQTVFTLALLLYSSNIVIINSSLCLIYLSEWLIPFPISRLFFSPFTSWRRQRSIKSSLLGNRSRSLHLL